MPSTTSDQGLNRRFGTLNAMRAAGAAMVLLTHCGFQTGRINLGWTGAVISRFDVGVALFFVVSGFLLARPHFVAQVAGRPTEAIGHYFWKRALRILPLYWTITVAALLIDPDNHDLGPGAWITHLTLTQIYVDHPLAQGLAQMWSLCTEVAFYLVLPGLVRLLSPGRTLQAGRALGLSAVLAAAGVAWQSGAISWFGAQRHVGQWLPGYLPWFLIGVAFAVCSAEVRLRRRLDALAQDLIGWWVLGTGLFAIACSPLAGPRDLATPTAWESGTKCVLYALAAGCWVLPLVFGPESEGSVRRWMASTIPWRLGEISFGVFCIHMLVLLDGMRVLDLQIFGGHFAEVVLMTAAVSGLLAACSYRWLERPALRLKNRGPFARADPARLKPSQPDNPDPATKTTADAAKD